MGGNNRNDLATLIHVAFSFIAFALLVAFLTWFVIFGPTPEYLEQSYVPYRQPIQMCD